MSSSKAEVLINNAVSTESGVKPNAKVASSSSTQSQDNRQSSSNETANPATNAQDISSTAASGDSAAVKTQPAPRQIGERGKVHAFKVNSSRFVIDARYMPLKPLGRGAYGVVCSATDQDTGKKVAIKKIPNVFDDIVDAKRILRETKMLHHFNHENIIGLHDLIEPPLGHPFTDIYLVLEYMETDLHKIIYSKNVLSDDHVQYFVYQALKGLKCIHSANVIHRDLKPSNLLVNSNCDLKICDFGLARGVREEVSDNELTEYVVTRWYRAPEVMYSVQEYGYQIDVWALGCILAELLGRHPLFPGDNYIKQINLIFDVLGTPSEEDMATITNTRALTYIKSLPPKAKTTFASLYPKASPLAVDLLDKMLCFNPAKRISVQQALDHPYFDDLRNVESEVVCTNGVFDFSFEHAAHDKDDLQQYTWDEIYSLRPWLKGQRGRGRSTPNVGHEPVPANNNGNNVNTPTPSTTTVTQSASAKSSGGNDEAVAVNISSTVTSAATTPAEATSSVVSAAVNNNNNLNTKSAGDKWTSSVVDEKAIEQ